MHAEHLQQTAWDAVITITLNSQWHDQSVGVDFDGESMRSACLADASSSEELQFGAATLKLYSPELRKPNITWQWRANGDVTAGLLSWHVFGSGMTVIMPFGRCRVWNGPRLQTTSVSVSVIGSLFMAHWLYSQEDGNQWTKQTVLPEVRVTSHR